MKDIRYVVEDYIKKHKSGKRAFAALVSLSMLVSFAVPMILTEPAVSQTKDSFAPVGDFLATPMVNDAVENEIPMISNMKNADGYGGDSPQFRSEVELLIGTGRDWTNGMTTSSEVIEAARKKYLLGIASDFCVFVENDFVVSDSDAEGRVAIGGNLDASAVKYTDKDGEHKSNYQVCAGDYISSTSLKHTDNYEGIDNFAHLILGGEMMKQVAPFSTTNKGANICSVGEERYKRFVVSNKFDLNAKNGDGYINVHVGDDGGYIRYNIDHNHYGDGSANNGGGAFNDEESQIYQTSSETSLIDFASEFQWIRARSAKLSKTHGIPGVYDESTQTLTFEYPQGLNQNVDTVYFDIDTWNPNVKNINFVGIPSTGKFYSDGTPECANIVVNCSDSGTVPQEVGIGDAPKETVKAVCFNGTKSSNGIHNYISTTINGTVISNNNNQNGEDASNPTWTNNTKASEKILYNFPNAQNIFLNTNFNGTVLAPNANVYSDEKGRGHLSGSLIAKSFEGGLEFGYRPYRGDSSIMRLTPGYVIPVDKVFTKDNPAGVTEEVKLANAHLSLYDDETGAVVDAIITNGNTNFVSIPSGINNKEEYAEGHVIEKTYTLKEDKAPDGFEKTDAQYTVTVTETIKDVETDTGIPTKINTVVSITGPNDYSVTLTLETEDVYSYTNGGVYGVIARKITFNDGSDYCITLNGNGQIMCAGPTDGTLEGENVVATKVSVVTVPTSVSYTQTVTVTDESGNPVTQTETIYEYNPDNLNYFKLGQMAWNENGDCPVEIESMTIYRVVDNQRQEDVKENIKFTEGGNYRYPYQFADGSTNLENVYGIKITFVGTKKSKFKFQYYNEQGNGVNVNGFPEEVWIDMDTNGTNIENSDKKSYTWYYPETIPELTISSTVTEIPVTTETVVYEDAVVSSLSFYTQEHNVNAVDPNFSDNTTTTAVDINSDGTDDAYFSPENIMFMPVLTNIPTFENKPNLKFQKIDSDGNPLKGAEIVLESGTINGDTENFSAVPFSEGVNGFNWNDKPSSDTIDPGQLNTNTLYRFREENPPANYETAKPIYFVKRTNSYISWTTNEELAKGSDYDSWNKLDLSENQTIQMKDVFISGAKIQLKKVELGTTALLKGASFVLKCGEDVVYPVGNTNGFVVTDGTINLYNEFCDHSNDCNPKYVKDGYLLPGNYSLFEVKAPDKYDCPTEPFRFRVVKDSAAGGYKVEAINSGDSLPMEIQWGTNHVNKHFYLKIDENIYNNEGLELKNVQSIEIVSNHKVENTKTFITDAYNGESITYTYDDSIKGWKWHHDFNSASIKEFQFQSWNGDDSNYSDIRYIKLVTADATYVYEGNSGGSGGETGDPDPNPPDQPEPDNGKTINRIYWKRDSSPEFMKVKYYHKDGSFTEEEISQTNWSVVNGNEYYYSTNKENVVGVCVAVRSNGFWNFEFQNDGEQVFQITGDSNGNKIFTSGEFPDNAKYDQSIFPAKTTPDVPTEEPTGKTINQICWNEHSAPKYMIVRFLYSNDTTEDKVITGWYNDNQNWYCDINEKNVVGVCVAVRYNASPWNFDLKYDDGSSLSLGYSGKFQIVTVNSNGNIYIEKTMPESVRFDQSIFDEFPVSTFSLYNIPNLKTAALKRSSYPLPMVLEANSKAEGEQVSEPTGTTETTETPLAINVTSNAETGYYDIEVPNKPAGDTMNVTVKKVWDDTGYEYLEQDVQVQLMKDGVKYEAEGVENFENPVTLTADTEWAYTWNNLPRDENTVYSVVEIGVDSTKYDVKYSPEELSVGGGITITNKLNKINITAEKEWTGFDQENANYIDYPEVTVKVQYKQSNENEWRDVPNTSARLTAAEHWTHEFSGLPAGYEYQIVEVGEYPGWEKLNNGIGAVTLDSETNIRTGTVINTLDSGSLVINKDWLGDTSEHDSVKVKIYRDVDRYAEKSNITAVPAQSIYEDYGRLLQYSLFLYDENMCGNDVGEQSALTWRDDCHTFAGMVQGGYHDAGDHVMFGLPQGFTASTLGWTFYEYSASFNSLGLTDHYQAIMKRFCDFFVAASPMENGEVTRVLYQRGTGETDHQQWITPEKQTDKSKFGDEYWADGTNAKASDIAAEYAAALALYALNFPDENTDEYLNHAKALYEASTRWNGRTNVGTREGDKTDTGSFYWVADGDGGTYLDEQFWAAEWLYLATGDEKYKTACDELRNQKIQLENSHTGNDSFSYINNRGHFWDDVTLGAEIVYQSRINENADWRYVNEFLGENCKDSYTYNDSKCDTSYLYLDPWGNSRHNTLTQLAALTTSKYTGTDHSKWAKTQMNHILGENPAKTCFVVGFADNSAKHPQHRAAASANGNWDRNDYEDNSKYAVGALVAGDGWSESGLQGVEYGASHHNNQKYIEYTDSVRDYVSNEVALDYNAGLVGAAAALFYNFNTGVPENDTTTGLSSKSLSDFKVDKYLAPENPMSMPNRQNAKESEMLHNTNDTLYAPVEINTADIDEKYMVVMNIGQESELNITGGTFAGFMDEVLKKEDIVENGKTQYASYNETTGKIKADENGTTNIILKKPDNSYAVVPLVIQLQAAVPTIPEAVLVDEITLSENNWTQTLDLPRCDSMGRPYRYYAVEVGDGTSGNITNNGAVYVPTYINNGIELSENSNSITISNHKTTENAGISMPSAGGGGTRGYYVIGMVITCAAGAFMFLRRRRTAK
ncbi:MAG: glycoside hydrolase family 9 protein [Ruminococcus sp.]|nr:glycoside hydrolase family 9 protein [Ruminococcus sp.]